MENKSQAFLNLAIETADDTWKELLKSIAPQFAHVEKLYSARVKETDRVFPLREDIFSFLRYVSLPDVRVVILGQDPYYTMEQSGFPTAHGLAFSVPRGAKIPPSLRNIFTEIYNNHEDIKLTSGCLIPWATQGVLLINSSLTVEENKPGSHQNVWSTVVYKILQYVVEVNPRVILVGWGAEAQKILNQIGSSKTSRLYSSHPSPLSANKGFLGCGHFSKINKILTSRGEEPIDWST